MRSTELLALACLIAAAPIPLAAQQDTTFNNVEYIEGSSLVKDKKKGSLLVSATDIRLIDKKSKEPYLIIPIADIVRAETKEEAERRKKEGAGDKLKKKAVSKALSSAGLGGLFHGSNNQVLITLRGDSTSSTTVVFKVHESDENGQTNSRIVGKIRSQLGTYQASLRAARKDIAFANVEYQSGPVTLSSKEPSTLVVSSTEVRLIDKEGKTYLAVPLAEIREVKDSSFAQGGSQQKPTVSGIPKIDFLKSSKPDPDGQLTIVTQKDSTAGAIVLQINEQAALQQIAATIRTYRQPPAAARSASDTAAPSVPMARLLITNPFSAAPADSADAVEVGNVVRVEIKKFVGDKLEVVTREQMNTALQQFGYPSDAVLNRDLAVMLAKTLAVPFVMTGDLKKGGDGLYTIVTMLGGVNDTTGKTITTAQKPGESLADFGLRIAETIK